MQLTDTHPDPTTPLPRRWPVRATLQLLTAAGLSIDAIVHVQDAVFYGPNRGSILNEAGLFRIQGAFAILLALLVLVRPRPMVWAAAAMTAAAAAFAVILYTYVDIGAVGGLPDLYEPSWGPPGKLASGIAESITALLATAGLLVTVHERHPDGNRAGGRDTPQRVAAEPMRPHSDHDAVRGADGQQVEQHSCGAEHD